MLLICLTFFMNFSVFAQTESEESTDGKIRMVVVKDKVYKLIAKDSTRQKEFIYQLFLGIGAYNANKDNVQLNKMLISLNTIFQPHSISPKKTKVNQYQYFLTGCMFTNNVLLILPFNDKCDNSKDNVTDKIIRFNFQSV